MGIESDKCAIPAHSGTFDRVIESLHIDSDGAHAEEWVLAKYFWHEELETIPWDNAPAMAVLLAEEVLVLRILSLRLLNQLHGDLLMQPRKTGLNVLSPTVEAWMKLQERFRKVMKELLEQYGHRAGDTSSASLAAMVQPILERGEGMLNELLSIEGDKEAIEKFWENFKDD